MGLPDHLPLRTNCIHAVFYHFILGLCHGQQAALFLAVCLQHSEYLFMSLLRNIRKCTVEEDPRWSGEQEFGSSWNGKIHRFGGCAWHDMRTQLSHENLWGQSKGCAMFRQTMPRNKTLGLMRYFPFYLKMERWRDLLYDKFALASKLEIAVYQTAKKYSFLNTILQWISSSCQVRHVANSSSTWFDWQRMLKKYLFDLVSCVRRDEA